MGSFCQVNGHALLRRPLRPGIVVLDLGANHGRFSQDLSGLFPGEYHAVEANPALADALEQQRVFQTVRCCAVTGESGPVTFNLAEGDQCSSVLTLPAQSVYLATKVDEVTVDGVALLEVMRDHPGRIDVLKADIEGAEVMTIPYLSDENLARIAQMTVEFHGSGAFGFHLSRHVRRSIRMLRRRGFLALDFEAEHRNTLFVNRQLLGVTWQDAIRWQVEAMLTRYRPAARTVWRSVFPRR